MTHEAKNASEDEVEKLADEVISENKTLLKRLESEEKGELFNSQSIVGEDSSLEPVKVTVKESTSDTSSNDFHSVTAGEYQTPSMKRNKVELITT